MIVSHAPSCGVTYNRHSDDSRGIIYVYVYVYVYGTGQFISSAGGHQLVPGQGWMDEGGRGGLLWTTEQQSQYHRYQVGRFELAP